VTINLNPGFSPLLGGCTGGRVTAGSAAAKACPGIMITWGIDSEANIAILKFIISRFGRLVIIQLILV
jgi:hypothetical protein